MSEEKYITMDGKEPFIIYNDYWSKMREKDIEIERLNKELETLKQPQVFIDTQDMEERYGEELYKEYLEKENKRLNNIINEIEKDIKNLYTYGIKNNAEQRDYLLNRLQELKGSDKE